jgi:hypothetical protein
MAKSQKKEPAPALVRVSTLKEYVKSQADVIVSGDFADAVNEQLTSALKFAIERCIGNGRKTLRPVDL